MDIQAVIFDMDGVLVDSEPGYNRVAAALYGEAGLPFGPREAAAVTGRSGWLLGQTIKEMRPDAPGTAEQLSKAYMDGLYLSLTRDVKELMPGAEDWMKRWKAMSVSLAVGSSSSRAMVNHVVERFSLNAYMRTVVTGDDAARAKPAPDIFLLCAQRLDVPPDRCLVLEDAPNGITAAHAAGMACAGFTGVNRHKLDLSAADTLVSAFDDGNWRALEQRFSFTGRDCGA